MDYNAFSNRIVELVDKFTQGNNSKFAELIESSEANVRNYRSGKTTPKLEIILNICTAFEINYEWLLTGEGSMLKKEPGSIKDSPAPQSNVLPVDFLSDSDTIEIPIVDIYAAAGHGAINTDYIDQLGSIRLPSTMVKRGNNYCVRIKGHSMSPTIQSDDYVIVRLLDSSEWLSMPDGHIYLVVDKEGHAYMKRIKNRLNKGFIVCTSDSLEKSLYPNFNLQTDEIFNIFHAEWYLSAKMQNVNEAYYSRLSLLEDDMTEIKQELKRLNK